MQEVEPSNGGALDITVANYYLPSGKTITRAGLKPQVRARDNSRTRRDEALSVALETLREEPVTPAAGSTRRVAVLEKRGRFLVGEPLFDHGPRTAVDRHGAGEGDLVLVGSGKRGARVIAWTSRAT